MKQKINIVLSFLFLLPFVVNKDFIKFVPVPSCNHVIIIKPIFVYMRRYAQLNVAADGRVSLQAWLPWRRVWPSVWRRFLWWRMSSSMSLSSPWEMRLHNGSVYEQLSTRLDRRRLQSRYASPVYVSYKLRNARKLVAWYSGRTSVVDQRTFPVLHSTYSWRRNRPL